MDIKTITDLFSNLGVLPAIIGYLLYSRSKDMEMERQAQKERNEIEKQRITEHMKMAEELHENNEILKKHTDTLLVIEEFVKQWKK